MDAKQIGSFIAALRKEQELTQGQLAQKLLVSDKAVSRWETGRGIPDIENLEALSRELGVSVAELLRAERMTSPLAAEEARVLTSDTFSLVRELTRKRLVINVVLGFLVGILLATLVLTHLLSPQAISYKNGGPIHIEELGDGSLLAIADEPIAGLDISRIDDEDTQQIFVNAYTTDLFKLTAKQSSEQKAYMLGSRDEVDAIYYFPGQTRIPFGMPFYEDVELWTANNRNRDHVATLPRLIYNHWIIIGLAASLVGLIVYLLLRKRWYAQRILKLALVPVCFTLATLAVLWGKFNEVYNAPYYASGICLVALVLYVLALVIVWQHSEAKHAKVSG